MKIVEYHEKYSQSIAKMWNLSSSSWGNDDDYKTAQDVIESERNSGNIKLYLAIDNEEVVGYCSFSEYRQDEGASYLPLINVRPDYHGKKIGKALILKVLEDAKFSKWPRIDLYTWSGNTKAMPLYKKCGFFWERRNNTVHLMNFLPYVYQTEALIPYLNQIDVYQDNIRDIHLGYDGEEEQGFDIYYYQFKNDHTYLNLGFEKTARGLIYLDHPDYQIRLSLDQHKVVFNQRYEASLLIDLKNDSTLDVVIQGRNHQHIHCDFNERLIVSGKQIIKIPFDILPTDLVQDLGKTHPCLEINLSLNGQQATLKCGVLTKPPIDVSLTTLEMNHIKNEIYHAYLDLENHLDDQTTFDIHCPTANVEFLEDVTITLNKGERRSIKIPYRFKKAGFYQQQAFIKYGNQDYNKTLTAMFKDLSSSFVCDLDKEVKIVSGNAVMTYQKVNHDIAFSNRYDQVSDIDFMPPKLGLPYSLEFNNIEPTLTIESNNQITLTYLSQAFKDVQLNVIIHHHYGLLEVVYEVINLGIERDISLSIPIVKSLMHSMIPYQSRLLQVDLYGGYIGNISGHQIDEHWIYNEQFKQGFIWPKDIKVKVTNWHFSFDVEAIHLKQGERFKTKPFVVSFLHPSLADFRKYVQSYQQRQVTKYIELDTNQFNPFIKDLAEVKLINHRKAQVKGTMTNNHQTCGLSESLFVKDGLQSFIIELTDCIIEEKRYLFKPSQSIKMKEKDGIYTVDNGVLVYQADINHSDSIFSLKFDGDEWIDANYPTPEERAWWASFVGGITQRVAGIQDHVAIHEKREMTFVEINDQFNNLWQGLKITTLYQSDPLLKGLAMEHYLLTMPGLALIHTFSQIINQTGKLIRQKYFNRRYALKFNHLQDQVRFTEKDVIYKVGEQAIDLKIDHLLMLRSTRNHQLALYSPINDLLFDSQKEYLMVFAEKPLSIADQDKKLFPGEFLFFTKDSLKKEDLCLLDHIHFDLT